MSPAVTPETLCTHAERSAFRETGRYAEVEALCAAFAARWPQFVRVLRFGQTPEGRPLLAMLVGDWAELDTTAIRARRPPVLMIQAGIHPGESDGKDAGFIVLRELLSAADAMQRLRGITLLFVPVLCADGHERMGPWNRANQNGPAQMGWRANAQNLNLNRDYAKLDAPEMRAVLGLMNDWDPLLCVDLHVADGADFEHDVSVQVEPLHIGDAALFGTGTVIRDTVMAALGAQGSLPLPFYPVLAEPDNPAAGFVDYVFSPRYSTGYWPLRNRYTMLVETHAWKDYATRVRVTANVIRGLIELAAANATQWRALFDDADVAGARLAGQPVAIDYGLADSSTLIDFRGYAYTREPSEVSGALMTTYQRGQRELWRVPFRGVVQPTRVVTAPLAGYFVAAGYALEIAPRLALHGITFDRLTCTLTAQAIHSFRPQQFQFAAEPNEGRFRASFSGDWRAESLDVAPGSLFVPIAQPRARLAMALLEPQAPDSFAAWGFFNAAFERKEYMEAYVAEQEARTMLAERPALAAEFGLRLQQDAAFAASAAARLDFFYRRHASWDQRLGLLPVFRCDALTRPQGA